MASWDRQNDRPRNNFGVCSYDRHFAMLSEWDDEMSNDDADETKGTIKDPDSDTGPKPIVTSISICSIEIDISDLVKD
jgi:hypothetical protein